MDPDGYVELLSVTVAPVFQLVPLVEYSNFRVVIVVPETDALYHIGCLEAGSKVPTAVFVKMFKPLDVD